MFIKNFIRRYMEQLDAGSASGGGGANTNTPAAAAATDAPAGTAPANEGTDPTTLTPEQQAAADAAKGDDKTDENKVDDPKAKDAPQGAPEKYEFKLADGAALNPDVQVQFEAVARELNMTQEAAQKLVETMGPKIAAVQAAEVTRVQAEWTAAVKADKEIGGQNFDANLAIAKSAVDRFGTPEFKTFLDESGLGNHPEMIRMMYKAGKSITEDKIVTGNQGNAPQRNAAKTLYPNSK